ncbi:MULTISPECIES: thiol-disulfide oxidoreductase DCC family protein [unclassified Haloparvum]|uniref:thiol-disulfide oxidoreductase DCC family protein n=1 Tax=Haloparvum sp. PAK95 TaxID=3418962 RepID=UPI003D2F2A42
MAPRLVYDDDCGFCKWFVSNLLRFGDFEPVGFSELSADQKARLPDEYENCMHLLTDTDVYSCGEAVEQSIARLSTPTWWLVALAREIPGYPAFREWLYRWAADRRSIWGRYRSREVVRGAE